MVPDVAERGGREVSCYRGCVRAGRDLALRRDAAVLRSAGAARLVIEQGRIRVAGHRVAHDLRLALGAHHHAPAVLLLQRDQFPEHLVVLLGFQSPHVLSAAGRDHEIDVERHRTALGRPSGQGRQLASVAPGHCRLDDEVEPVRAQAFDRGQGLLERALAVAEAVVVALVQRVHADARPPSRPRPPGSRSAHRSNECHWCRPPRLLRPPRPPSASASRSSRRRGSPPDRMRRGDGFTASSWLSTRRQALVSSSPAAACQEPAEM